MSLVSINKNPTSSQLRQFAGIWFPLFALVVGYLVYAKAHAPQAAMAFWIFAAIVSIAGVLVPQAIKPVFVGLMYLTFPIGLVVSYLVLVLTFFGVFLPVGLLMRAFRYDPMHRRFDRSAKTYWTPRNPNVDPKRYFKQY